MSCRLLGGRRRALPGAAVSVSGTFACVCSRGAGRRRGCAALRAPGRDGRRARSALPGRRTVGARRGARGPTRERSPGTERAPARASAAAERCRARERPVAARGCARPTRRECGRPRRAAAVPEQRCPSPHPLGRRCHGKQRPRQAARHRDPSHRPGIRPGHFASRPSPASARRLIGGDPGVSRSRQSAGVVSRSSKVLAACRAGGPLRFVRGERLGVARGLARFVGESELSRTRTGEPCAIQ